MSASAVDQIKLMIKDSFCQNELGFQHDGYLSFCEINTFVMALPTIALALYTIPKLFTMGDSGPSHSRLGHAKMVLMILQVLVTSKFGPEVFNIVSLTTTLFGMMATFILTFMEFNGVQIPAQSVEMFFHILAASNGYRTIKLIADHVVPTDPRVIASASICLVSFINGAFRNIVDAIDVAGPETKSNKN